REGEPRPRTQPRNRILREASLWPLARTQPKDLVALARIEDMHPRTVRQDGETILALIGEAAASDAATWPAPLPEPLPLEAGGLLKKLRAVGQREAERLDIAPELMLRKKSLEALIKSGYPQGPYRLPDSLRGWRRELMGQALLDVMEHKQ
ncbi:HRDC domain-containing protein, partial [Stutzerimonas balearica]|uniref:HRDC domain-containing protein n=1 Tax=Stutzerimonas balearica TaxID=74829 RepID=UPI0032B2AAD6